jgi:outer membrane protein OmpA-like peptidoglycan-associated protein
MGETMKNLAALLTLCFLLSACAEPMSNAQKGSIIGAISGAIVGQAAGKDTKSTLIGAGVGAAAGGGIGYYMDQQEKAMRNALASVEGVNIVRQGDVLFVTFRSDNQFDVGSFILRGSAQNDVARMAAILAEYDKTKIVVTGHTDSSGSEAFNQTLSEQRAGAVSNIMLANGVASGRITKVGFGESQPIADNNTNYGRQINRRVEIKITPT